MPCHTRQIAGAAFDCFVDEPPTGSPLLGLDNLWDAAYRRAHARIYREGWGCGRENVINCSQRPRAALSSRLMPVKQRINGILASTWAREAAKALSSVAEAQILGFGAADYSTIESPTRWNEQNPETLIDALIRSVRNAVEQAGSRRSLPGDECRRGASQSHRHGQSSSAVNGDPAPGLMPGPSIRPRLCVTAGDGQRIYRQTGCPVHSMYPIYKLIWLREKEPRIFNNAARFVSAKAYVIERLTGRFMADYNIASGSGLLEYARSDLEFRIIAIGRGQT